MNRISLIVLLLMISAITSTAQLPDAIIKKYKDDTTGFVSFPDGFLMENLHLPEKYKKLEINTWVSLYTPGGVKYQYRNLYRYPVLTRRLPDTAVLSKCDLLKCFAAFNGPSFSTWYISAQLKDNTLKTIGNDTVAIKSFLGNAGNEFNACLWLNVYNTCHFYLYEAASEVPVEISHLVKYKKVDNGFLILTRARISNCPISSADLTYFVGNDFRVVLISKKNISVFKGCT
jgi:hypothetical protein